MNAQLQTVDHAQHFDSLAAFDILPAELSWKEKVAYLGYQFRQLRQVEMPLEHIFGHGFYIRTITIPARTLFIGRAHRHGHMCTLLSGSAILISSAGRRTFDAVTTVHTVPGFHMVLFTLTDVVGQTMHPNPTDSRDTDALEQEIFEPAEAMTELGRAVTQRLLT